MTDYYSILGVDHNATSEEIKKAYRGLAMRYHPDRTGGDDTKFKEIQSAYDVLSDPAKKAQHDTERSGMNNFNHGGFHFTFNGQEVPPGFGGFDDILRQFHFQFGGGDPFAQFRQPKRNKDIRIQITIPLSSTLEEQIKIINVQTSNGSAENVEVKFPRGISNGTTIKYPNLGDNFFDSLERGDLYIQVNVEPHERFEVHGLDLVTEIEIDCLTAILGSTITVKGLDDKVFSLQIPAGTQHNRGFRINDQGLWQLNNSTRGSLIVKLNITIPNDFEPKHLDMLREISRERIK